MRHDFSLSARDRATELLEGYIDEQGLSAGDRLPSEREMCEMWGLNRTTLRSAIRRLIDDGVLYSRVGSGTYIAPEKFVRDLHDVKGFSAAVRASGRQVESRVLAQGMREADKILTGRLHITLGSPVFTLTRLRSIDGVPAVMETTNVNAELFPGIEDHDFTEESLFGVMRDEYGIEPFEGDETLSITTIDEDEVGILMRPAGTPAFFQRGVIVDREGTPLEYFKAVVLSQSVRFGCELRV